MSETDTTEDSTSGSGGNHTRSASNTSVGTNESFASDPEEEAEDSNAHMRSGSVVVKDEAAVERNRGGSMFGNDASVVKRIMSSYGGSADLSHDMAGALGQLQNESEMAEMAGMMAEMGGGQVGAGAAAEDEIAEHKDLQDRIENKFTKLWEEDDVDLEEFSAGLRKMNVELADSDISFLFSLINIDDEEYVQKNDIILFLLKPYDNPDLHRYKMAVLNAILGKGHGRSNSLLRRGEERNWSMVEMGSIQKQMTESLIDMTVTLQKEVSKEQQFLDDIDKQYAEDPAPFAFEKGEDWGPHQVCRWLMESGFEAYVKPFFDESVDGSMLLHDVKEDEMLMAQLGIKQLHFQNLRRKIQELNQIVRGANDIELHEEVVEVWTFSDPLKQSEVTFLRQQLETAELLQKSQEHKISDLSKEIEKLNATIQYMEDNAILPHGYKESLALELEEFNASDYEDEATNPTHRERGRNDSVASVIEHEDDLDEEKDDADSVAAGLQGLDKELSASAQPEDNEESAPAPSYGHRSIPSMSRARSHRSGGTKKAPKVLQMPVFNAGDEKQNAVHNAKLLKILATKKEGCDSEGTSFADPVQVQSWTNEEVAYWVTSINFGQYALPFFSMITDGDMLLNDVDRSTLNEDLFVKKIHTRRILECINDLKRVLKGQWDEETIEIAHSDPEEDRPTSEEIETLNARIEEIKARVEELEGERNKLIEELQSSEEKGEEEEQQKGYFATKIEEMETEREELKTQLEEKELALTTLQEENETAMTELNTKVEEMTASIEEKETALQEAIERSEKAEKRGGKRRDSEEKDESSAGDVPEEEEHEHIDPDMVIEEVKKLANEDPNYGDPDNVLNWTKEEVAYWLYQLQFEEYIGAFINRWIDGQILVADVNDKWLKDDLKIRKLHLTKVKREIEKLRARVGVEIETAPLEKPSAQSQKDLEEKQQKIEELSVELENEIKQKDALLEEITLLEQTNKKLEADNLQLEDANDEKRIAELESLIDWEREIKMTTVTELSRQIDTLRMSTRVMQREITWLYEIQERTPVQSVMGALGYTTGGGGTQGGNTRGNSRGGGGRSHTGRSGRRR